METDKKEIPVKRHTLHKVCRPGEKVSIEFTNPMYSTYLEVVLTEIPEEHSLLTAFK